MLTRNNEVNEATEEEEEEPESAVQSKVIFHLPPEMVLQLILPTPCIVLGEDRHLFFFSGI